MIFQIIALASLEKESVKVAAPAKMRKLYAWIVPAFSFIVQGSIYANALGWVKSSPTLVTAFWGLFYNPRKLFAKNTSQSYHRYSHPLDVV